MARDERSIGRFGALPEAVKSAVRRNAGSARPIGWLLLGLGLAATAIGAISFAGHLGAGGLPDLRGLAVASAVVMLGLLCLVAGGVIVAWMSYRIARPETSPLGRALCGPTDAVRWIFIRESRRSGSALRIYDVVIGTGDRRLLVLPVGLDPSSAQDLALRLAALYPQARHGYSLDSEQRFRAGEF